MSFLDNLSLKSKLILLLSFPVIGLLVFSGIRSVQSYDRYLQMDRIETLSVLATKISSFVHETQKERGMTAGFIGSDGKKFADKLPNQRELTNKKFKDLKALLESIEFENYSSRFKTNLYYSKRDV